MDEDEIYDLAVFVVESLFTLIYIIMAGYILAKYYDLFDKFTKSMIVIYAVGFMCKQVIVYKCYDFS
jgi:hypothetical protein